MSDYEKQAAAFLEKHGIKFRATLSDSKPPPWKDDDGKHGRHYRVTLSKSAKCIRGTRFHGSNSRITFDFWSSIADAEKGITTVTPYDVLACISNDTHCAESFEDWCGDMGERTDSIRARQTYNRCAAFARRLNQFFTPEEVKALREIQ